MSQLIHSPRLAARAIDVVVIGAGHAGLAISRILTTRGVEHVVLERGQVANSWRQERWDSLKLLTPNWQTRLPGFVYDGDDPDGFMSVAELIDVLDEYARATNAPIITGTEVTSVRRDGDGHLVLTNRGTWNARAVVLATGACNAPSVPKVADDVPADITQLTPFNYRSPEDVPAGSTLIVGASATGLQLADELLKAGRDVILAAGEHVRMPRRYRGKDIFYWMTQSGIHDERYEEVDDIARGRRLPSPQLVGSTNLPILDINHLQEQGAKIAGRLMRICDGEAQFSGSLRNICQLADLKMKRLLKLIDETADREGAPMGETIAPTRVDGEPLLSLDLNKSDVRSVIWATGFRPDYSWLDIDVLDHKGHLRHDGGVVDSEGLYVLGLPLMRRRKSSFIFGIEDDARDIADHLIDYMTNHTRRESDDFYQDITAVGG